MDFILEQNRAQCAAILEALLAAPAFSFDEKLPSRLPVQHGLDVIARNGGSGQCEYLARWSFQDGILGTTQPDLDQHFWGGGRGAESDLVDKVVKNIPLGIPPGSITDRHTRPVAQTWIRNSCPVQWLIEEDGELRCWAEHYMLSILRPIWER